MEKNERILINKFKFIPIVIISLLLSLSLYIKTEFQNTSIEQLLYSLFNAEGTSISALKNGIIFTIVFTTILSLILIGIISFEPGRICSLKLKIKTKSFSFNLFPFNFLKKHYIFYLLILYVPVLVFIFFTFNFKGFIQNRIFVSNIYEEEYINPQNIEISFPENKQNLIYIYLESTETTTLSKENGGAVEVSYMPGLEEIAVNNINFSNTSKLGGPIPIEGTTWTIAGMLAQTSGIPLKTVMNANDYGTEGEFIPGVVTLGDILKDNGYNNYLTIGSDSKFAGRDNYFKQHGDYQIFDYFTAIDKKYISKKYYEWWGFEDKKLFEYAKKELFEISKNKEPFNFTLLTADTHFPDGYVDSSCDTQFQEQYANSFYCSSSMVTDFVNWIQKQDFYENTTIVLVGDHLTLQTNFYNKIDENYTRTQYNAIINSRIEANDREKNRVYTPLDLFPTTLGALGVEIDGDRLGLGTNLFSNKETIPEEIGIKTFNEQISMKSKYYTEQLLRSKY